MAVFNKNRERRQACRLSSLRTQLNTVIRRNACEVLGVTEYYGAIYYNYNGRRFAPFILEGNDPSYLSKGVMSMSEAILYITIVMIILAILYFSAEK